MTFPHFKLTPLLMIGLLTAALGGCTYLNRSEGVTVHGGDAVRANLERETASPTGKKRYSIKGLGRNGSVIPEEEVSAPTASPAP